MADTALTLVSPQDSHSTEPVVVFDDVSIGFEGNPVLKHVSFRVAPGETRILLGPAGVGKSILLKLANGLIRPDSGRIFLFGEDITQMRERDLFVLRNKIGMVFQESALFDSMNVRDNVAFRLLEEHVDEAEINQRVEQALRFVELEHTMEKFPSELSGGMRRRVAIARAIITRPELLLYDSPTGGLDPITSTTIIELIVKQRDVYRTSSLLVTHRLQDAFVMATHRYNTTESKIEVIPDKKIDPNTTFLVLNEGELVFDGSTRDLLRSDNTFLKEFLA